MGQAAPFTQTVSTSTGAVPVTKATLLLTLTAGLTAKLGALTAASCDAMLARASEIHGSIAILGFSTLRPLATNALYFAFASGPVNKLTSRTPLTNSSWARQYIRRKAGVL